MREVEIASVAELPKVVAEFFHQCPTGAVVGLTGELGAGKTTFVRECVFEIAKRKNLHLPKVISPSFVLHQSYVMDSTTVDHFDLYRLPTADESSLSELGYFEVVERRATNQGFVFVEWPGRAVHSELLEITFEISIDFSNTETSRIFRLTPKN